MLGKIISIMDAKTSASAEYTPRITNVLPAREEVEIKIASEHTPDPIKKVEDIYRISDYFIERERYRDNMLFISGINFGLRIGDLLQLRVMQLLKPDGTFQKNITLIEQKTEHTRKVLQNRHITINEAVVEAASLYFSHTEDVSMSDYLFKSLGNRGKNSGKPLDRKSVDRILKQVSADLGLTAHVATHTLRKTFAYHQLRMSNHDPRKLVLLQQMFGHSSQLITLRYAGITAEEIGAAYEELNLGKRGAHKVIDFTVVA